MSSSKIPNKKTQMIIATMPSKERKTEHLTERALADAGFDLSELQFQGSEEAQIQSLLHSKKSGRKSRGYPEFIVRLNGDAADLLVIECKRDLEHHSSVEGLTGDSKLIPADFAEDGVLHYMRGLKKEFNVIGLAVSGESELRVSTFMALRGGQILRLPNKTFLSKREYVTLLRNEAGYGHKSVEEILMFARDLHNFLRDEMELSDQHKPLIVSGILLALQQPAFEQNYRAYTEKEKLARGLFSSIDETLLDANIDSKKRSAMMGNYEFIKTHPRVKQHLKLTIATIYRNLFFAIRAHSSLDLLGTFYGEFLRYSGGDQKGLGIVLTPRHITELFSDLADVDPATSVVLDICAGSGGFLISAMSKMITRASGDGHLVERVKQRGMIGIELAPHMFTLACANMILRGDGQANMFLDDALAPEDEVLKRLAELKPNIAFLNPPYSKKDKKKDELAFVKRSLDLLDTNGGIGIAIVPVGRLIDDGPTAVAIKREILEKHTLTHVMSMPPQLFPKVGTVTAIAVFKAHKSHWRTFKVAAVDANGEKAVDENGRHILVEKRMPREKTWFGYWRDDGFMMRKNVRVERSEGLWPEIKARWLADFWAKEEKDGYSCNRMVTHRDEWVAEAYLKTDYSALNQDDFDKEVKKFLLYRLMENIHAAVEEEEDVI